MLCLLLALLHGAAQASQGPNGLCILKGNDGGIARGFVIGQYLISAAHVFDKADGEILCTQDGVLVDISNRRTREIEIHPAYLSRYPTKEARRALEPVSPYDLAVMKLASNGHELRSDLIIDPSLGIEQSASLQSALGMATVIRVKLDGVCERFQTIYDLSTVYESPSEAQTNRVDIRNAPLNEANSYLEYDMPLTFGDSGVPVILPLQGASKGQYLVVGLVVGTHDMVIRVTQIPHSNRVIPTTIAPAVHLATWLSKSHSELFLQKTCAQSVEQDGHPMPGKPVR